MNQGKVNAIDKAAYQYESSLDGIEETNEQCSEFHDQTNELYDNTKSQNTSVLSELDPVLFEEPSVGEKDQNRHSNEEEDEEPIPPPRRNGLEKQKRLPQSVCTPRRKGPEKRKQLPQSVCNYLVMLYRDSSAKYEQEYTLRRSLRSGKSGKNPTNYFCSTY